MHLLNLAIIIVCIGALISMPYYMFAGINYCSNEVVNSTAAQHALDVWCTTILTLYIIAIIVSLTLLIYVIKRELNHMLYT